MAASSESDGSQGSAQSLSASPTKERDRRKLERKQRKKSRKDAKRRKKRKRESREEENDNECMVDGKETRKVCKRFVKLMDEVKDGLLLRVEKRISQHPSLVNMSGADGRSALHEAAARGEYQLCLQLLRRGALLDQQDREGDTPLLMAAKEQRWEVAELLADRGAAWDVTNAQGQSVKSLGLGDVLEKKREAKRQRIVVHDHGDRVKEEEDEREREHSGRRSEREWQEKLWEEHAYEHLEGGGGGGPRWGGGGGAAAGYYDAFFDMEELSDGEDWWEAMGRKMRQRQRMYSARTNTDSGEGAKESAGGPENADASSKPSPDPGQRWSAGHGPNAKFAWERGGQAGAATEGAAVGGGSGAAEYEARMAVQVKGWDRLLELAQKSQPVTYKDVPWPAPPPGLSLADEALLLPPAAAADPALKRKAVREALRRWHPDKFGQKFGALLHPPDHDQILEEVKKVSQALTSLVV